VLPTVSIVIPVRDEAAAIEQSLDSCLAQDYDGGIEIVVADAMSEDGTRSVISSYATDHNVTMVDNVGRTTPAGLNAAIHASSGEIIVRCDAHSVLPEDYVSRAVEILQRTGASNVGGVQRAFGIQPMQRAIGAAMSSPFGVGDARFHMGGPAGPVDTVYLGVFQRAALDAVGGFDETLIRNQDYELNYRLRKDGGEIYFDPSLEVVYRPRPSLTALGKQYFGYGQWKRVVARRHPRSVRWRQLVAPLFVVGLGLSAVTFATGHRRVALIIPGTYLVANVGTSLVALIRRKDAAMLLLPSAFLTMHLSWGIGFLTPPQVDQSDE
jgi:glycosyltransferase involved in cell wall biosynthesis